MASFSKPPALTWRAFGSCLKICFHITRTYWKNAKQWKPKGGITVRNSNLWRLSNLLLVATMESGLSWWTAEGNRSSLHFHAPEFLSWSIGTVSTMSPKERDDPEMSISRPNLSPNLPCTISSCWNTILQGYSANSSHLTGTEHRLPDPNSQPHRLKTSPCLRALHCFESVLKGFENSFFFQNLFHLCPLSFHWPCPHLVLPSCIEWTCPLIGISPFYCFLHQFILQINYPKNNTFILLLFHRKKPTSNIIYEVISPPQINLNLIKPLDVSCRATINSKWYHGEAINKTRMWETLWVKKSGFFNTHIWRGIFKFWKQWDGEEFIRSRF